MNTRLNQWLQLIKTDFKLFLWISLGVFLFILFFQPFPIEKFDFNNRLLIVAGFAGIVLLLSIATRTLFPSGEIEENYFRQTPRISKVLCSAILLVAISVAFAFYLRYVGSVEITFFIMFKVVFIGLAAPVIIRLNYIFHALRHENESLLKGKNNALKKVAGFEHENLNKTVTFISDNASDNLTLRISEIAFIKSADNYVEVFFREGTLFKKQLLRNKLKTIEQQLLPFPVLTRCHRSCIVNATYIRALSRAANNHWISIDGWDEKLPVSRQYLLKTKELSIGRGE